MLPFKKKKPAFISSIKQRILKDELTKLRVKHDLWYQAFEKQERNKVWLDESSTLCFRAMTTLVWALICASKKLPKKL